MAKKRAFVKYTKQGKIVPGSLVLTSGTYPDGPALWQEVPTDLCCETSAIFPVTSTTTTIPVTTTTTVAPVYEWNFVGRGLTAACGFFGSPGPNGPITLYSSSPSLSVGVMLYQDQALTIPAERAYYCTADGNCGGIYTNYDVGYGGFGSIGQLSQIFNCA